MSRSYSQDEVAAILKEAYRLADGNDGQNQGPGLTLAELEDMAVEHGLDSATIRAAAAKLDSVSEPETFRTYAGIRWRVGHRAMVNGTLSDAQWAAIVADCRQQFRARGEQTVEAGHRVWRNGNLFVSAEPTVDGLRTVLHMGSRNDTIPGLIGGGLGPLLLMLIFLTLAVTGVEPDFFVTAGILAPIGFALAGAGIYVGRNWIEDRERQMALIADRAIARSGTGLGASTGAGVQQETVQERIAPETRDLLKDLHASPESGNPVRLRPAPAFPVVAPACEWGVNGCIIGCHGCNRHHFRNARHPAARRRGRRVQRRVEGHRRPVFGTPVCAAACGHH